MLHCKLPLVQPVSAYQSPLSPNHSLTALLLRVRDGKREAELLEYQSPGSSTETCLSDIQPAARGPGNSHAGSKGSAKRRYGLLPQELGAGSSLSYAMRCLGKPHRRAAALGK